MPIFDVFFARIEAKNAHPHHDHDEEPFAENDPIVQMFNDREVLAALHELIPTLSLKSVGGFFDLFAGHPFTELHRHNRPVIKALLRRHDEEVLNGLHARTKGDEDLHISSAHEGFRAKHHGLLELIKEVIDERPTARQTCVLL